MIGRIGMVALIGVLGACGGGETRSRAVDVDEAVMIQQGTYVYNPNARHAPVSLSGADLYGIARQ